jgi:hypothetical protein
MLFIWGEKCPRRSLSRNKRARGNVITRWPSHGRGTSIFPVNYVPFREQAVCSTGTSTGFGLFGRDKTKRGSEVVSQVCWSLEVGLRVTSIAQND